MGSEASKPIEPPKGWESKGASKSFQIISPVSDISNPSEIHRFHPKPNRTLLVQRGTAGTGPAPRRRHPSSRRISKTAATSLPPQAVSRNARGPVSEVLPPTAFYFPTKESERYAEQRSKFPDDDDGAAAAHSTHNKENTGTKTNAIDKKKESGIRKHIYKVMTGCLDDTYDDEIQHKDARKLQSKGGVQPNKNQVTPMTRRRKPNEASRRCSFEESLDGNDQLPARTSSDPSSSWKIPVQNPLRQIQKDSSKNQQLKNDDTRILSNVAIVKSTVSDDVEEQRQYGNEVAIAAQRDDLDAIDKITSLAIHHEDEYFNRLSMSSNHDASPFTPRDGTTIASSIHNIHPSHRLSGNSVIDMPVETTKSNRRSMPVSVDTPIDTPVNDMAKKPIRKSFPVSNDTHIDEPMRQSYQPFARLFIQEPIDMAMSDMVAPKRKGLPLAAIKDDSPVSSLLRFYTKTGPMESSPAQSFRSEEDSLPVQVFSDEISESSSQQIVDDFEQQNREEATSKRESQASDSSLYTFDMKNYQNIDGKSLQLVDTKNAFCEDIPDSLSYSRNSEFDEEGLAVHLPRKAAVTNNPITQVVGLAPVKSTKDAYVRSKNKMSKLETLFRPVLPALSSDDAQSITSYDPYEIKVTESAPGMIQSEHCISLALRRSSSQNSVTQSNQLVPFSPSMVSIDTQHQQSPSLAGVMISEQAECNAEFLFANDYGPVVTRAGSTGESGTVISSISTSGARSRLTQRSVTQSKGVVIIPVTNTDAESRTGRSSSGSYKSGRRVRFSSETVKLDGTCDSIVSIESQPSVADVPVIEQVISNLTDSTEDQPSRDSGIMAARLSDGASMQPSVSESIDLPEIERNVSDVTDAASVKSRRSTGSSSIFSVHETIQEDDEKAELSPETSIHWTYNENGVTPYVKGNPIENGAKSPFIRFKNAKKSFSVDDRMQLQPKKSPIKIPKVTKSGSGGIVSARIEELNSRVSEIRKMKRMQKKTTNPRLHTHNFDNKQPVRSRALMTYKTSIKSADIGKSNTLMAAKFNVIPDVYDDDLSSFSESGSNAHGSPRLADGDDNDDDVSKLSEAMSSIACSSVATVRQERGGSLRSSTHSETSVTTASSGFTNIKKQVFRVSDASRSLTSNGDSTTLSAIIQKENESYLPFRAGTFNTAKQPQQHLAQTTQQTPMQAMKWRSLAMAAQEKDAQKVGGTSSKKQTRGLSLRVMNA